MNSIVVLNLGRRYNVILYAYSSSGGGRCLCLAGTSFFDDYDLLGPFRSCFFDDKAHSSRLPSTYVTMPRPNSKQKPRKTFRQALRDLLTRNSPQADLPTLHTIGSGILRKAPTSFPQLPNLSAVSEFPDFATVNYSTTSFASRMPTPSAPRRSRTPHVTDQDRRLLPALSLVDLNSSYFEAPGPQQPSLHAVPSVYESGLSRQASLVSAISRPPSASSLRIRNSRSSIHPHSRTAQRTSMGGGTGRRYQHSPEPLTSSHYSFDESSRGHDVTEPSMRAHLTPSRDQVTRISRDLAPVRPPRASSDPMMLIEHFKCFVVLDTALSGCPVTGTSYDLRYIFDIGEHFVLNNQECEGSSLDITTGFDADGNQVVHLLLFTPLVVPSSGRSRFMLVALVDVTEYIAETASQVPELDTISEESSFIEEAATPSTRRSPHWSSISYKLSADDLLGGCSLAGDNDDFPLGGKDADEDIWLALAAAEGGFKANKPKGYRSDRSPQSPSRRSASTSTSHASSTDGKVEDFMASLQELYSDMFVLGPSPLADDAYEICNVSPRVYESKEYIDGHLSQTSVTDLERLSRKLGELEPFSMKVRWGTRGEDKRLYCNPLYGRASITWICYLVNGHQPRYW